MYVHLCLYHSNACIYIHMYMYDESIITLCMYVYTQALETMVTHYVDAEEFEKSMEIVENFTTDLSSVGAGELASTLKK